MIIVDSHLHCYPSYNANLFLRHLFQNLLGLRDSLTTNSANVTLLGCLTERSDCKFYNSLLTNNADLKLDPDFIVTQDNSTTSLKVIWRSKQESLYLLPGHQIISKEGLELLCVGNLNAALPKDRGNPLAALVELVLQAGAMPILNWSPGKWLLSRGRVVDQIFDNYDPSQLAIGLTNMLPNGFSLPKLVSKATHSGFQILAGSDPLPLSGEEALAGSLANVFDAEFDPRDPYKSFRTALNVPSLIIGARLSLASAAKKQLRLKIDKYLG